MSNTRWGPGYEIAGRYRLVELLGRGGMGEVWRAEHVTLKAPVAIKLIDPKIASTDIAQKRFLREARAAAALQSPHVVHTSDFGVHEDTPFIAMELLQGESLAQRLRRLRILSAVETARVITHICRAIQKAHDTKIIHRDLKPDNVFIAFDDDEEIVKVLDFGVAKAVGGEFGEDMAGGTRTGALLGTPYYMSPEQAQGERQIDHRSDLWSLAVIAFQCLTGRLPFEADGLGALVLKICSGPIPRPSEIAVVPPGFDEWFHRALMRDPAARFQTAKEMARALRAVLTPSDAEATGAHASQDHVSSPHASAAQSSQLPVLQHVDPRSAEASGPRPGVAGSSPWNAPPGLGETTSHAAVSEVYATRTSGGSRAPLIVLALLGVFGVVATLVIVVGLRFVRATPEPIPSAVAATSAAPMVETAVAPVEPPSASPNFEPPAPAGSASASPPTPPKTVVATPAKPTAKPPSEKAVSSAEAAPKPSATPTKTTGRLGF